MSSDYLHVTFWYSWQQDPAHLKGQSNATLVNKEIRYATTNGNNFNTYLDYRFQKNYGTGEERRSKSLQLQTDGQGPILKA
jgi:hypothetical protein